MLGLACVYVCVRVCVCACVCVCVCLQAALIKAVNEGNIMPFDTPYNPEAHSGTDFNRWYNTTEAYEVQHKGL